jgi:hypothetical protein
MSAWTVIGHREVGAGGAANIEFTSIAGTYTDLAVLINGRSTRAGSADDNLRLSLNGITSNFSSRFLYGQGSTTTSETETNYAGQVSAATATASTFGSTLIYIPNYTSTVAKSYSVDSVSENNGIFAVQVLIAGLWNPAPNVAITSLAISCGNGNLTEYSSATLYGITKGSSGGVTVS